MKTCDVMISMHERDSTNDVPCVLDEDHPGDCSPVSRVSTLEKKLAIDNAVTIIRSCGTPVRGGDWYNLDPSEFPFGTESQAIRDSIEYLSLIGKLEKHTTMPYLVRIV